MTTSPPDLPLVATPHVCAGALFRDGGGRVLLVEPTYKEGWDVPGGYVEPGESPLDACVREVREELGIAPPIGGMLAVDWSPAENEGDKILFLFDGGVLAAEHVAAIALEEDELRSWAFHAVGDAEVLLPPRALRRVEAALAARDTGRPRYLEWGTTPSAAR